MRTKDFLRGRRRSELSEEELAILERAIERTETLPARRVLSRRGEVLRQSTLLIDGYVCRYMDARDGYRQILSYQVSGDFVDLHGYPTRVIDHDIATITEATLAYVPHERLDEIMASHPHLAKLLWFSTLLDAAMHREWIFRIGRLDAVGRLAHFLCETHARMLAIGRADGGKFALPMTQQDIGEACGLTSVHVNRVVRRLREDGLASVSRGMVDIADLERLARVGEFDASYLYMQDGPWQRQMAA
ncbi:Crp/Fnr family transcriptional regulator [Sphingomonas sp. NBWT7]|uniref:Crp/Fnr family transcriptional regulator n=1 Tax=Sphingomonas sp. NBWT7 TaxID=2596913 RepID=UPI00162582FB|nr:Crp/Fnr family transcriptional regulator [Sphingomonas sp. NBWT7]QNE31149.1 Crp/Fnr family transcriptional regulator [Sphingomonas sp. NBWT7]